MLSGNGAYLLAFVWGVAGCLLPIASQGVYMKDFFPGAGYVAVMYLFTKVCGLLLFAAVDLNTEDKWWRLLGYLPLMSVTAVCGPPVFWLLSGLSFFKDEEATVSRTSIMLIRRG
jgi:hypothetical protein